LVAGEDGRRAVVQGVALNVTERKQADEERRAALAVLGEPERRQRELHVLALREQGRLAALLSAMGVGVLFEDGEWRVEYVNPAFRGIWGLPDTLNLTGGAVSRRGPAECPAWRGPTTTTGCSSPPCPSGRRAREPSSSWRAGASARHAAVLAGGDSGPEDARR
jgi:PAS domain-containing protein